MPSVRQPERLPAVTGASIWIMEDGFIIIGLRDGWGGAVPFGISQSDRRQHLYLLGRTGVGKSTLMFNMAVQDIHAGHGIAFIDPHGDNARMLIDHIPPHRINDTVYFDPADADFPIGLNLVRAKSETERHLVASSVVSAFKSIWRDSWGPRLEYLLSMTVSALLECENVSLLGAPRVLVDENYRAWVVRQIKDPILRAFWMSEFAEYGERFMQEAIAPVLNKVNQLLTAPQLRNILGQVKSGIDARFMMDNGRIFIADVSKGRLGEDKAALIGALLVTQFQLAAMSRANVPEHARRDFMLHVDEFQSFTSDAFISILSEARKYRLCLTLSHQYMDQLRPEIRSAVFGNVGSVISFRVGERDAEVLEREFGNALTANQFVTLGKHEVFAKLLHDGEWREPFLGMTMPPLELRYGRGDTIIGLTRERFGMKRVQMENKIMRWRGTI
jgi:hypothetical protein